MSGATSQVQARRTPQLRKGIRQTDLPGRALAMKYDVTRSMARKWEYRDTSTDGSYQPHKLHTALPTAQEAIVVEQQRSLLLYADDLLVVVVRKFIEPDLNRSTLQRLLVRHGVPNLRDLVAQPEDETKPAKAFKDCEAGFMHVDIKYRPAMADEQGRTYLFVAIDRGNGRVYMERHREKSRKAVLRFTKHLREKGPFHIYTLLTDNDQAFTDLFTQKNRRPSRRHVFDRLCTKMHIDHRLTPPRPPQKSGLVKRFNGRISEILRTAHFNGGADLDSMLWH